MFRIIKFFNFFLLLIISLNTFATEITPLPKKIFELDLTEEKVSTQGGGLEVLKAKDYCILSFKLYGEMGQEKYAFKFNKKGLISTRHVAYKYPMNVYEIKSNTKIMVDFDKTYKINQSESLLKKFHIYKKRIPNRTLNQC